MKLELTKDEMELLCELVFLGNWIVNSHRLQNDKEEKYEVFAKKIERLHREILSSETLCKDMSKFYFETIGKYIDEYDNESCLPTLAEKLAKVNFSVNPNAKGYNKSIHMRLGAQHIYEKELLEKGVAIISIDIPDIEERLENFRKVSLKKQ